jgi:hypothetical protein
MGSNGKALAAAGYAFSILFLKIAQRFNAGAMASIPDRVPQGRKERAAGTASANKHDAFVPDGT